MEFINETIGEWMAKLAREYPDQPAVVYHDKFEYSRTYSEFNRDIDRIAKAFLALGIRKGDHVAMWATNYPQWMLTLFASARIGAVLVTVNTAYKIHEVQYLLKQSDSKMLIMSDGYKDTNYNEIIYTLCPEIRELGRNSLVCAKLPWLRTVINIDNSHQPGMYDWDELDALANLVSDEALAAAQEGLSKDDVVNMQYTSGTTGFPKGVMLTHYNILNNGQAIGDCMNLTTADKLCISVPFYHCFGLVLGIMACITHATTMVIVDHYSPQKVLDTVESEKCTALHGVPTMFIGLLEHPTFKGRKFNLRTGIMAGSPCPIKVMRQVVDEMGMSEVVITYGQTEASPACTMTRTTDSIEKRITTVGQAIPEVETKIIDPVTGETLGPHQNGEFCARGYNIMRGYYKMPEATAAAIDAEGWLHTGDIACVDEEGYYKITGRIKDMIIRGGENIYPKEIEDFIYTHPGVSDVQVIGVPSAAYGEEIMACVIPKAGVTLTEDDIKNFVRESMAKHKIPSYVWFMDSFPMTGSGKIQKFKLREMAIEKLSLQKEASIETA